jgi:hypothetical protein
MKTIKDERHVFKQVKTIPSGYRVWNIPSIGEGCVPLYLPLDEITVDASTLCYLQLTEQEAKVLHSAASYGIRTLADVRKALASNRKGPTTERRKRLAQPALPIFEKYTKEG